jgi:hypothetical protein
LVISRASIFTAKDQESLARIDVTARCSARTIVGVARRCEYGAPQVIICTAEKGAKPFPTTFWLTCQHLVRISGRLESQNGVSEMEVFLEGKEALWRRYHVFHSRLRVAAMNDARKDFLRIYAPRKFGSLRRSGVGGISYIAAPVAVKCLHLQIASYLGLGFHPASDWLMGKIPCWECADGICV